MDEILFGRRIDVPLDENGAAQAAALAHHLADQPNLLIDSSPRRRTLQTAHAIAAQSRSNVRIVPELDEIDFGRWSGERFARLADDADWRRWNERRDIAATPAGESIASVQARLAKHLSHLQERFSEQTIAIVTHAEVIRSAVLWLMGRSPTAYGDIEISPASITTVRHCAGEYTVEGVNQRVSA